MGYLGTVQAQQDPNEALAKICFYIVLGLKDTNLCQVDS